VALGCNELGDNVRESVHWCDVEDWERVFAVLHTSVREDVGDKVNAGVAEQR
jgi:hypothetical protein